MIDGVQERFACRSKIFLPVRVLSRLFRRLFIEGLFAAHAEGRLKILGSMRVSLVLSMPSSSPSSDPNG
jgi:hypothetical protein